MSGGTVTTPNPSWVSPEDTTNACAAEGGFGVLISPVDAGRNSGSFYFLPYVKVVSKLTNIHNSGGETS